MEPCSEQAVWVIVPEGEAGIAVCRAHTGYVLEHLLNRKAIDYGFAYIPQGTPPAYACEGASAGKCPKKLSAEAALPKAP
jgi:hypothetical protein